MARVPNSHLRPIHTAGAPSIFLAWFSDITILASSLVRMPPRLPRGAAPPPPLECPGAPTVRPSSLGLYPMPPPCSYLHALFTMRSISRESIGGLHRMKFAPSTAL